MFIQVIRAPARDPAELERALSRWSTELAAGANGWLGSTAGVDEAGTFIALVRFESEAAARRNSDRPSQGEWWKEFSRHLAGEAAFEEYSRVELFGDGGSDEATFVQVMRGQATDIERLAKLGRDGEAALRRARPEVIGGTIMWRDDGMFTQAVYFTSEGEARAGEKKDAPEVRAFGEAWAQLTHGVEYMNLNNPWLISA